MRIRRTLGDLWLGLSSVHTWLAPRASEPTGARHLPPSRAEVVAAAALFVFVVHWSYRLVIAPAWEHAGLAYQPAADGSLIFALIAAVAPAVWLPRRADRVSTVTLWILYAVPFVPASLVPHYVLGAGWGVVPLNIGLLLAVSIPSIAQRIPVPTLHIPSLSPNAYAGAVATAGLGAGIVLVASFGLGSLPGLDEIYDTRAEYKDRVQDAGRLVGYVVGAAGTVIFPFLIVLGLARRQGLLALGATGVVLVYSITGYRSALFAVPLAVVMYVITRYLPSRLVTVVLTGFATTIGLAILTDHLMGTGAISAVAIRRTLSVPGQLTGYYYDFFSTHPTYGLGHSVLGWLQEAPYAVTPPRLISMEYFGNEQAHANANLWADGYANFGMIGLVGSGVLLAALLWIADVVARDKPLTLTVPVFIAASFSLTNSGLLTSLLSHGIVAALILLAAMPSLNSWERGQPRTIGRSKPRRRGAVMRAPGAGFKE